MIHPNTTALLGSGLSCRLRSTSGGRGALYELHNGHGRVVAAANTGLADTGFDERVSHPGLGSGIKAGPVLAQIISIGTAHDHGVGGRGALRGFGIHPDRRRASRLCL